MHAALAGALYFLVVYVAGFALGVVRVLLVAPRLGATRAVLLELPFMLAASWVACRWIVRRLVVPPSAGARLIMGGCAFALLMLAETAMGVLVFDQTPASQIAPLGELAGMIGLGGQMMFALLPLLQPKVPQHFR